MENAKEVSRAFLTGERALFHAENLHITDTIFDDGESPLKESSHIELEGSMFKWKYPLWYCNHITVKDCQWFEMAILYGNVIASGLRWQGRVSGTPTIFPWKMP